MNKMSSTFVFLFMKCRFNKHKMNNLILLNELRLAVMPDIFTSLSLQLRES